jgi:hypothetical protein
LNYIFKFSGYIKVRKRLELRFYPPKKASVGFLPEIEIKNEWMANGIREVELRRAKERLS